MSFTNGISGQGRKGGRVHTNTQNTNTQIHKTQIHETHICTKKNTKQKKSNATILQKPRYTCDQLKSRKHPNLIGWILKHNEILN